MPIDAPLSIQQPDAPQAVMPPQAASSVTRTAATRFDSLAHSSAMPTRQAGDQSYRAGLRQFEANWDYDPTLHVQQSLLNATAQAPTQQATHQGNGAGEAERLLLATILQGNTMAQQAPTPQQVDVNGTRTRYSDIIAASEAAAVEALRTSPDDQKNGSGQNDNEEERRQQPSIGLVSRAAKKEWLRCVSSTPRPMRPTAHLPKLG